MPSPIIDACRKRFEADPNLNKTTKGTYLRHINRLLEALIAFHSEETLINIVRLRGFRPPKAYGIVIKHLKNIVRERRRG